MALRIFSDLLKYAKFTRRVMSTSTINTNMASMHTNIVWVDLEMTGLDINKDTIMEIACLVTDTNLNIISEEIDIVINQPDDILNNMDEWCLTHHRQSGLTQASKSSKISMNEAEEQVLNIIKKYTNKNTVPLAGNSVYVDRMFIKKYMPKLDEYLHYRLIDVSSIKELAKRWNPEVFRMCTKRRQHRALSDIKESIEELKMYKNNFLKTKLGS